jgi:hypothetical protein
MASGQILHNSQVLATGLAPRIEVWDLAYSNCSVTATRAESLVVTGRCVENTSVVPNSDVIRVVPLEADLKIVAIRDKIMEPLQHVCTFLSA